MSKALFSLHKEGLFNKAMVDLARISGRVYCSLIFPLDGEIIRGTTGLFHYSPNRPVYYFPKSPSRDGHYSCSPPWQERVKGRENIVFPQEILSSTEYRAMVEYWAKIGRRYKRAWAKQKEKKKVSLVSIWWNLKEKQMKGKASPAEKRRLEKIEETLIGATWAQRFSSHLQPQEF